MGLLATLQTVCGWFGLFVFGSIISGESAGGMILIMSVSMMGMMVFAMGSLTVAALVNMMVFTMIAAIIVIMVFQW